MLSCLSVGISYIEQKYCIVYLYLFYAILIIFDLGHLGNTLFVNYFDNTNKT